MLKIIDKYLIKEISFASAGVIAVLLMILLGNSTLSILKDIADGSLRSNALLPLLGINLIHYLVILLPLAYFLGIMLAMGRLYKDSEMAALSAGGVSIMRLYRPVFCTAAPVVCLTALLAFVAVPWTSQIRGQFFHSTDTQAELSGLTPGRFNRLNGNKSTLFLEKLSADRKTMQHVFVQNQQNSVTTNETARTAVRQYRDADQATYLLFSDGTIYSRRADTKAYQITEYQTHGMKVPAKKEAVQFTRISTLSTSQLWQTESAEAKAELHWRIGVPILTLLLAMLALPLSYTAPRKGRYSKVLAAVLMYIIYTNLLSVARALIEKGSVPDALGLWWAHAVILIVTAVLVSKQMGLNLRKRQSFGLSKEKAA